VKAVALETEAMSSAVKELLESLAETPIRIASASRDHESARLQFRPDEGSWSANDILAHLRACADVWGGSITVMLTQDHPTLRYVSPRSHIRKTRYPGLEFRQSLQAFARQRDELLASLRPLTISDWSRGATFTATAKAHEHTVLSYVRRITQHESEHCAQMEALLR
jgi:hypothetical protein